MNFYSYDEIRASGDCIQYATTVLSCTLDNAGRCQALWRGGEGYNVEIHRDEWYDHGSKTGGGIIELCATARHNDDLQMAQNELGQWLNLEPAMKVQKGPMQSSRRYEELIAQGYTETKRYNYNDLDGNLVHFVARFEHPEKEKEFMQGTPDGWGLRDTAPILYRQGDWIHADCVVIVEGEKDADTVNDVLGIPATTNCGGADKWRPEYAALFKGKKVVIIEDNDDAGKAHSARVSRELKDTAAELRVIVPSIVAKGDVTDWVEKEGGSKEALIDLIKAASVIDVTELVEIDLIVEDAKRANKFSLCNYTIEQKQIGKEVKHVRIARPLHRIIKETNTRFLGFPCRIGSSNVLFDHDRNTGNITQIKTPANLFAWMGLKSGRTVSWVSGEDFPTKEEFLCGVIREARVYEGVSQVPEWPRRADVYYAHGTFPDADPDHKYLKGLCDFWTPASESDAILIKTFFCAGLWYRPETNKPLWLIDANARGAGKTQLVTAAALLFYGSSLDIDKTLLTNRPEEIMKNLLSAEGRDARYVLFDNADGLIKSSILAKLVTQRSITGRPAFGSGMEVRPNNVNYCITSNSATLDDDLAIRAMIINLVKPDDYNPNWDMEREAYIKKYQRHIIADILSVIEGQNKFEAPTHTRFSRFEKDVLQKNCDSADQYKMVMEAVTHSRELANLDNETASLLEDIIRERLLQIDGIAPGQDNVFIHTQVFSKWIKWANESEFDQDQRISKQDIRNFAKNGHTKFIKHAPDRTRIDGRGSTQIRGFYWEADKNSEFRKVVMPGFGENKQPRLL
jgi:hypothetical protein